MFGTICYLCVRFGHLKLGGGKGTRTPDPLLAKQMLSQLSYAPKLFMIPSESHNPVDLNLPI